VRKTYLSAAVIVMFIGFCVRPVCAESAEEWNEKGKTAYRAQNYEEAHKYYSKALEIDPKMQKALFNRALNSYRVKKYKETRSDLAAVLAIDPKDHEAIFYIGLTYFGEGKYKQAFEQFEKAAEIKRLPLYLLNCAAARYNACKYHATIQHCKMALRLNPEAEIRDKANALISKAEEHLKEDKERLAVSKRSLVRMENSGRPRRVIEIKWIQTADTSGGSKGGSPNRSGGG
jgi:tetratricopeptide (TPR) repeat protein